MAKGAHYLMQQKISRHDSASPGSEVQHNPLGERISLTTEFYQNVTCAGAKAPSGDNLQPWSFAIDGDSILVCHDSQRDRSLFNVRQLASYIALGAVVENIHIAASVDRYHSDIEL